MTDNMTPTVYDDALHMMEVQGGSFVKSLAHCYCMADPANKVRLKAAFADYFGEYQRRYDNLQVDGATGEQA